MFEKLTDIIDAALPKHAHVIITIEGPSTAGKSSLADFLQSRYAATIIHMDHFFLPPELRDEKRLCEAGGNVHYERFLSEVVEVLLEVKAGLKTELNYRPFDCAVMRYGDERHLQINPLIVIEGVYSQHPVFGDYSDLKLFLELDPKTQHERIKLRESLEKQARFFNEWIPMEQRYFAKFGIKEKADLIL